MPVPTETGGGALSFYSSEVGAGTGAEAREDATAAILQSFAMIIFSEIGDKTFLIASILAMRHPRLVVFLGAFGSLLVMSLLSAVMGHLLPSLIPKRWTQIAAGMLFVVFGSKMWVEARSMKEGGAEKMKEEMKEAEETIEAELELEGSEVVEMKGVEEGKWHEAPPVAGQTTTTEGKKSSTRIREGIRNLCSLFLGPVFVQAFVLTFLGEWGDRSQIATIALGAAHNVYVVSLGTIIGHSCCTGLAVVGGRYIATKISVKQVTYGGSVLFLLFGAIYLYEAWTMTADIPMEMSMAI